MKEGIMEQILEKLENDLHIERNIDFIVQLFDERADTIHFEITKDGEYRKNIYDISQIDEEIREKSSNYGDIITIIEKMKNIIYKNSDLCEKLMYKHGIYDGIKLMLEGTKDIDIEKFLKENKSEV